MRNENDLQEFENKISELTNRAKKLYEEIVELSRTPEKRLELEEKEYKLSHIVSDIIYYKNRIEYMKDYQEQEHDLQEQEDIQKRKEKLLREKAEVEEKIRIYENALNEIEDQHYLTRTIDELNYQIMRHQRKLKSLEERLRIYKNKPDLTDGEIDIYLDRYHNSEAFFGRIYIHNQDIEIGNIEYRGQTNSYTIGDIGYRIDNDYRGHNYAYKALNLIQDLILETGRDNVIITTQANNISSKKTIEKFGGVLIPGEIEEVLVYSCHLTPKKEITETNRL